MGFLWDLLQQSQISKQRDHSASLESRLQSLEAELDETRRVLRLLIERLERNLGEDVDGDGRIG